MIQPRFSWQLLPAADLDPAFASAAAALGLSARAARVLRDRGVADPAPLTASFAPRASVLGHATLLPDAARVVVRLAQARLNGERVMVYADNTQVLCTDIVWAEC